MSEFKWCSAFLHITFSDILGTLLEEKLVYNLMFDFSPFLRRGYTINHLSLSGIVPVANEFVCELTGSVIKTEQVFVILLDTLTYPDELLLLRG
jgi:hypothetical protein